MKARHVLLFIVSVTAVAALLLGSCKKTTVPFRPATPLTFTVPPGFPQPYYNFMANPASEEGFLLGRKLFYDGRLSIDGYYPCSSCHEQRAAFTTFEHDRSHGYNYSHTLRNAPGLANLAWYPGIYLQDGSATTLESIYYNHITNPHEMAETIPNVLSKLRADSVYPRMFQAAFGDPEITQDRMFNALTQFVINLVSANSKYDQMLQGTYTFNSFEQSGYAVFQAKCASCHKGNLFTDFSFRNNGLPLDPALQDFGRMRVTHNSSDSLKFRVPSLRNVALTSYYGHDGRMSYMYMMIDHYLPGAITQSPTLDPSLVNGIALTQTEQDNLLYFLRTLTDSSYINNPRYRE
jgi:cytochrome c peroxidase